MPFFRPASRALSHLLRHDPTCHLSSPASLFSRHSPLAPFTRAFDHPFFSSPLYTIYEVRDGNKDSSHTKAEQHKPEEAKAAEPQQPQQQQQSTDSRLTSGHEDSHRQRWLSHRSDRRHRHRHHSHHHLHPLSLFSPFDSLLASSPFFQQAALQPLEIKLDLYSTPTAYQVNAAIPGVRKEDIKLTVEDGVLTIEAERREERGRASKPTATASTASTPATTTTYTSSTSHSSAAAEAPQAEQKPVEVEAKADGVDTKFVAKTKAQEPQQQQQQEVDEDENEDIAVHHVESHYGRVQRSLALPEDVNVDGLTARYEDGVLRIELPRVEEEKKQQVKQINIQ